MLHLLSETGLILIHLVTAGVGMLEKLKDTFTSGKRRPSEAFQAPDQVIALHRFGQGLQVGGSISENPEDKPSVQLTDSYRRRVARLNGTCSIPNYYYPFP